MPKKIRMDFREFSKYRYAGLLVILVVSTSVLITVALYSMLDQISSGYQELKSYEILHRSAFENIVKESFSSPIAVMFRSTTCPECKAMYPYWLSLELHFNSPRSTIKFYDVVLASDTAPLFNELEITDLPTFIVFYQGQEIGRHVGVFSGKNITSEIIKWINNTLNSVSYNMPRLEQQLNSIHPTTNRTSSSNSLGVTTASLASLVLIGFLSSMSPCVFPLLLAGIGSAALLRTSRTSCVYCIVLVATGVIAIASLFLAVSSIISAFQSILIPIVGSALVAIGFLYFFNVPTELLPLKWSNQLATPLFCLLYGLLIVQCNFPVVLGALLLIVTASNVVQGLILVFSFAIGASLPVALVLAFRGYLSSAFSKLSSRYSLLGRIGGVVLSFLGIILIVNSFIPGVIP